MLLDAPLIFLSHIRYLLFKIIPLFTFCKKNYYVLAFVGMIEIIP